MWWYAYKNDAETSQLFPRQSLGGLWTLGYLFALTALLCILGISALSGLATPVALCGLYVFLSYVTGTVGMLAFLPLMASGWLSLVCALAQGMGAAGQVACIEAMLVAIAVAVFLVALPHVRAKLLIPVVVEGALFVCGAIGGFALLTAPLGQAGGEADPELFMRYAAGPCMAGACVVSLVALGTTLHAVLGKPVGGEAAKQELMGDLRVFGLGLVVVVGGTLLSMAQPLLGVAALIAGYGGIAALEAKQQVGSMGWSLVPLVLLGSLAAVAAASAESLPALGVHALVLRLLCSGPFAALAEHIGLPLLGACDQAFGGVANGIITTLARALSSLGVLVGGGVELLVQYLQNFQAANMGADTVSQSAVELAWTMPALPSNALITGLVGLYLVAFLSSAVMGAVLAVLGDTAPVKNPFASLVTAWRETGDEQGSGGRAGSREAGRVGGYGASGFGAGGYRPGSFGSVPDEATTAGASTAARPGAAASAGSMGQTAGAIPAGGALSTLRHLRAFAARMFGPLAQKLNKDGKKVWDEQLSGQLIDWDGAEVSPSQRLALEKRRAKSAGPGLWWKVFEDDGRTFFIPKGDIMGLLLTLAPLCLLLWFAPSTRLGALAAPLALVLLGMGMSLTAGSFGMIVSGPAVVMGWSSAIWLLKLADTSYQPGMGAIVDAVRSLALVCAFTFFTSSMRREAGGTVSLAAFVSALAWYCARRFAVHAMDEATVRVYMSIAYAVAIAFALVFAARALYMEWRLLRRWEAGRADEIKSVALTVAGVLPLVVSGLLASSGSLVALAGATACYVVLACVGRLRSPKGLCCLFIPLVLGVAFGFVAQADASIWPPSAETSAFVGFCTRNGLARFLANGSMPLARAFKKLLGPAVITAVKFLAGQPEKVSANLVRVLCFYPGIFGVASVMGVAVSALELLWPGMRGSKADPKNER